MRANSVIFPDFFENFTAGISENAEIIRVFSREGSFTGIEKRVTSDACHGGACRSREQRIIATKTQKISQKPKNAIRHTQYTIRI